MALCPRCNQRLVRVTRPQGIAFQCPACQGCAVGVAVLRKSVPNKLVNAMWLQARQEDAPPGAACPICQRPMAEVPVPTAGGPMPLDVCAGCQFVWFDTKELERLPALKHEPGLRERLPEEARERIALAELKLDEEKERLKGSAGEESAGESPEDEWKWIPGMLGLPVEMDDTPLRHWPWLTWALLAAMAATFALTVGNLKAVVDEFGLVPAQLGRHGGITFITSFFLHGGFFHLLGNAYFLLIFGDHAEDELGRWRYALLIAGAALFGDLLHIMGDPRGMVPCIGASGGISGVIAFYALRFPRARLGFLWQYGIWFRWIYLPAWLATVLWLVLQGVLVTEQIKGAADVSALAHLGGFAVGVGVWVLWRLGSAPTQFGGDGDAPAEGGQ